MVISQRTFVFLILFGLSNVRCETNLKSGEQSVLIKIRFLLFPARCVTLYLVFTCFSHRWRPYKSLARFVFESILYRFMWLSAHHRIAVEFQWNEKRKSEEFSWVWIYVRLIQLKCLHTNVRKKSWMKNHDKGHLKWKLYTENDPISHTILISFFILSLLCE